MKLVRTALTSYPCAISVAVALFACTARAAEFKEFVGFIETAGSQYAVLDYVPRSNTVIRAEVAVTSRGANTCVFCSRGSATNARTFTLFALMSNDGWRFDYNNINNQPTKIVPIERQKVTLVASCEGLSIDNADPTKPFKIGNFTCPNKLMLFGSYQVDNMDPATVSISNWSYLRVYSLTISDDEGLKYDLVPCRDTNNVFGLYDKLSGQIVYSNTSTAFSGGVVTADVYEDDPTVIETSVATTYSGDFTGTGKNRLVFTGKGLATLEGSASQFKSVAVDFGTVRFNQLAGALLTEGDAVVRRGCADYIPLKNTSADAVASLATDGSVTYGPVAEITLNRNSCKSATLNLGSLVREASGGTLLLKLGSDSVDSLGGVLKLFAEGYAEGEILPATIVSGKPADGNGAKFRFLQYTAANGLVPAPMTEGFGGGASAIASVSADTTLSESAAVKGLVVEFGKKLTMGDGVTLTLGDGVNPAGVILADNGSAAATPLYGGAIDFGDSEGVIWGSPCYNSKSINLSKGTVIKGNNGVTFTTRVNGAGGNRARFNALPASGAMWSGPTHIEGCYYNGELPRDATSGDIFVEGNANYGASLFVGGKTFNNKVHLAGPGQGSDKWYALWTEGAGDGYLNGTVTLETDATVYSISKDNRIHFNGKIDGPGGLTVRTKSGGTGYVTFATTNVYEGVTTIMDGAALCVNANATLGVGPLQMPMGRVFFTGRKNYVFNNTVSGPDKGELRFVEAAQVGFSKPVDVASIGTVKIDGTDVSAGIMEFSDSVRFGGMGNAHFATVRATAPGAKLEFTGSTDYTADMDVAVGEGASIAFAKTGANTVTLSGADEFASVDVKEGTLAFEDGSGILDDTESISFWLDADDETTLTYDQETTYVTEWRSKVGEATFKANKAGGTRYPRYGYEINGRKAVTFAVDTSQAKRERLSDFDHTLALRTTFVVARCTRYSSKDWTAILGRTTTDDGDVSPALRLSTGSKAIRAAGLAQGAGFLRINGRQSCESLYPWALNETTVITAEMTANSSGNVAIGGYHSNRDFSGQICEVIEFNRQLTNAERKYVEGYLAKKWGVAGVSGDATLGKSTALTVAAGATLDLNGHSAVIDSLDGTGSIVNTSGKKVTLKVKNSGTFKGTVGEDVELKLKPGFLLLVR